ncbi:MAG: pyridoxamine 5'-phosphate oxidase family protein [Firmicutes bacterium]|nr:pyridoxamine 5'-phosphate oxidase family protein [Bacillota bacterium]
MPEAPSPRTRVRRHPERGVYDRAAVYAILDEALYCHVAFARRGHPFVLPTLHARVGDRLYLHGAPASAMLGTLAGGAEACVAATLVDGLVLARSAYHHSLNYRSAVVFGHARDVAERAEKLAALEALTDHVLPGRWRDLRPPTEAEVRSTRVLRLDLEEVSAKVRAGPPGDVPEDPDLEVWAGVVPVRQAFGLPEPAPDMAPRPLPPYLARLLEGRRA